MQAVSVYLRGDSYFIVVIHGSGGGEPCIASGPVAVLAAATDAQSLGSAVFAALSQSTSSVAWPTDWKKVTEPLLTAGKVKTWPAFAKQASNVRVDRTANEVSVSPTIRGKASFMLVPEKVIRLLTPHEAQLGAVVASALLAQ
jgi:hypothetical protein